METLAFAYKYNCCFVINIEMLILKNNNQINPLTFRNHFIQGEQKQHGMNELSC